MVIGVGFIEFISNIEVIENGFAGKVVFKNYEGSTIFETDRFLDGGGLLHGMPNEENGKFYLLEDIRAYDQLEEEPFPINDEQEFISACYEQYKKLVVSQKK